MKNKFFLIFTFLFTFNLYAQNVEKVGKTENLEYFERMNTITPTDLYVDEVKNYLYSKIERGKTQIVLSLDNNLNVISKRPLYANTVTEAFIKLNQYSIHFSVMALEIKREGNVIANTSLNSGISFILKKDKGYIVYYVNEKGIPGAIDTEGKIYSNREAIEFLKIYDPEKFARSTKRAMELGLKAKFDLCEVLVWGETYYTTTHMMEKFYKEKDPYIVNDLIQYDINGYGYQLYLSYENSELCIVNPDGTRYILEVFEGYKHLKHNDDAGRISSSWYVGFGGNIYYYIAGEEYTEVFRIRRTWGNPDFYAMAINGYTEDEYGKYVNEVLPKMSKADLRLLRNTIFALYGVHFKSEDLAKFFEKQVWYTDEGKSSGEVTLPENRQKLVEMIQKLEK